MFLEEEAREALLRLQMKHPRTKKEVKGVLLQRKRENLLIHRDKLKRTEHKVIRLIGRVEYDRIDPVMAYCASDDRPVWNYLRHCVSSAPWQNRPGRALYLFCVDKHSGGILGIVDMGSDLQSLGPRDRHIGWTHKRKLKGGGLRCVANLGTCVAVSPFGLLTGGKCMSVMMIAQEFADVWLRRYGDKLAATTTTSLFGKSSQYNRLKEYRYLGNTSGGGIAHLSRGDSVLIKRFVRTNNYQNRFGGGSSQNAGPGGGWSNRLNDLIHACELLSLDFDDFKSGQPRGVYFAERGKGVREFLRGESETFTEHRRSWCDVAEWWLDRWYSMRWPKKREEIGAFDYNVYRVDNQIDLCADA